MLGWLCRVGITLLVLIAGSSPGKAQTHFMRPLNCNDAMELLNLPSSAEQMASVIAEGQMGQSFMGVRFDRWTSAHTEEAEAWLARCPNIARFRGLFREEIEPWINQATGNREYAGGKVTATASEGRLTFSPAARAAIARTSDGSGLTSCLTAAYADARFGSLQVNTVRTETIRTQNRQTGAIHERQEFIAEGVGADQSGVVARWQLRCRPLGSGYWSPVGVSRM